MGLFIRFYLRNLLYFDRTQNFSLSKRLDQQENEELKSDNDILRSQIEFVKSIMPKIEPEMFKNVKLFSLSEIDKFHHINTSWQEDELTGVHITLNSLQTRNEESLGLCGL